VSAKARRSASISTCRYSAATQHATDPPATCRADHARRRVQLLAGAGTALPAGCVPALRAAWGVPELCWAPRRPAHSMILSANSAVRPAADTTRCAVNRGMPLARNAAVWMGILEGVHPNPTLEPRRLRSGY
jgi:hypothetical protein